MPYENGPFIMLEVPNEDTGQIDRKYVSVLKLLDRVWDDYIREKIPDEYCREMLREIGFSQTQILHAMEQLQLGKAEYNREDYREVLYV